MDDTFFIQKYFRSLVISGNIDEVRNFLNEFGLSCTKGQSERQELLRHAVQWNSGQMVNLLLSYGFELCEEDGNQTTPLHLSVLKFDGDLSPIEKCLDDDKFINARNELGQTALFLAVNNNSDAVVKLLLQCGACPNICDNENISPLHQAVCNENLQLISMLLNAGAVVNARDINGFTSLQLAIENNNDLVVQHLLNNGAEVNICDNAGLSPMHTAVIHKNSKIVSTLLNYGASVDKLCSENLTPLLLLLTKNKYLGDNTYELVQVLLANGARLDLVNSENQTPLLLACQTNDVDVVSLLITSGADIHHLDSSGRSVLHISVENNNYELTKFLLEKGLNANAVTNDNVTAIHLASSFSCRAVCELLTHFRADLDILDNNGNFPLSISVEKNKFEIAEFLLEKNVNVNQKTKDNLSVIFIATKSKNEKMVRLLLKFRPEIDLNMKENNETFLHLAINEGWSEVVDYIYKNCKINKENDGFQTSLLKRPCSILKNFVDEIDPSCDDLKYLPAVIKHGLLDVFKDILAYDFDINVLFQPSCYTPLHLTVIYKRKEMTAILISRGAKVDIPDFYKKSAFMYAAWYRDSSLISLLLKNVDCSCDSNSFNFAVWLRNFEIVEHFLLHGYDVNRKNSSGKTGLHFIIDDEEFGYNFYVPSKLKNSARTEMAELLFSYGADVNAEAHSGVTTLYDAIWQKDLALVETLLRHKANVNCVIKESLNWVTEPCKVFEKEDCLDESFQPYCSLLHLAVALCHEDSGEYEAEYYAKKKYNIELVEILLKNNATIDLKNEKGLTPLHIGVSRKNLKIVALLLNPNIGSNPNIGDDNGTTPLLLSALVGRNDVFEYLLMNGSDINVVDNENNSLIDYITKGPEEHREEMLRFLRQHIVKLKIADLFLSKIYVNFSTDDVALDFVEVCKTEIIRMKNEVAYSFSVTFYDLLTFSLAKLVSIVRKENFLNSTESIAWKEKYQIYGGIIQAKLVSAKIRSKLLQESELVFHDILPSLPRDCLRKILCHLTNEELIIICGHQPSIVSPGKVT